MVRKKAIVSRSNTLVHLAQAKLWRPQIQSYFNQWSMIFVSLVCVIASPTLHILTLSPLTIVGAIISIVLMALLPSYSPDSGINLCQVLRVEVFAIVKAVGSFGFYNLSALFGKLLKDQADWRLFFGSVSVYMYILVVDIQLRLADDDLGLTDDIIYAMYAQMITLLNVSRYIIDACFIFLILFKHLQAQEPAQVQEPEDEVLFDAEDDFYYDTEEGVIDVHKVPVEVVIQVQAVEIEAHMIERNAGDGGAIQRQE